MKYTVAAMLIALASTPAAAETLSGPAQILDGDTLVLAERHVRLFGIDAPEKEQMCKRNGGSWACGEEAGRQFWELVGTNDAVCIGNTVDQYDRLVAVCHAGHSELNKTLVEHGWATAF